MGRPDTTKFKYSFLKVLTGSDLSRRRLPIMAAESVNPGPVVWLTACGHGDEVGGIVIIQEIFRYLRKKNALRRGGIHAFPLMNAMGFENDSRHITLSEEDLNRCFPGNPAGSLAERIANMIFTTITETAPSLVLDLHNDWLNSIPYALLDMSGSLELTESHARSMELARRSGLLIIGDDEAIDTTLSRSLLRAGIPSLTMELGESYVVNEKNIIMGVRSILQILSGLGIVENGHDGFEYPFPEELRGRLLRYHDRPLCSSSGIIRFQAKPGDSVRRGQPIARIHNAFGKVQETMKAGKDGIVLACRDSSVAFPGLALMAFGAYPEEAPPFNDTLRNSSR